MSPIFLRSTGRTVQVVADRRDEEVPTRIFWSCLGCWSWRVASEKKSRWNRCWHFILMNLALWIQLWHGRKTGTNLWTCWLSSMIWSEFSSLGSTGKLGLGWCFSSVPMCPQNPGASCWKIKHCVKNSTYFLKIALLMLFKNKIYNQIVLPWLLLQKYTSLNFFDGFFRPFVSAWWLNTSRAFRL